MARQGLNATFSYRSGRQTRAYRVRANLLSHGMKVVFDESSSRTRKAFYPHRLSSAQFAVGVELVGYSEHRSFSSWLAAYADFALDPDLRFGDFPAMVVSIPSRNFMRRGVPLSGYEWGDQVGGMIWAPVVVFETSEEPLDAGRKVSLSKVQGLLASADRDVRYFYPTGTQLGGSSTPPDGTYTKVLDGADLSRVATEGP